MGNLFPDKCGIYAPRKQFGFVQDCLVLPAPLPIWDAPELRIDPAEPPPPVMDIENIPCPNLTFMISGSVEMSRCFPVDIQVDVAEIPSMSCGLFFDLRLKLPKPQCPTIQLNITPLIDLVTPCQQASAQTSVCEAPQSSCAVDCEYQFDVLVPIQIPRPACPQAVVDGTVNITMATVGPCDEAHGYVQTALTAGERCAEACELTTDFTIMLEVPQAKCPTVDLNVTVTTPFYPAQGDATLEVANPSPCAGPDCTYGVMADFVIPIAPPPIIIYAPLTVGDTGPAGPQGEPGPDGNNGRNGRDGSDGRDGRNGLDGLPGRDGSAPAGDTGPDGYEGPRGETGPEFGADGGDGPTGMPCSGPKGDTGPDCTAAVKPAIVPIQQQGRTQFVGLLCTEMPEVIFEDVVTITQFSQPYPLDSMFLQVCEPDSIRVVSVVADVPEPVHVTLRGACLHVVAAEAVAHVVVRLAGTRRGCRGVRFPERTDAARNANNRFYGRAML